MRATAVTAVALLMSNCNSQYSLMLLQDYRDGALGCISLETSQSRAAMLALAAANSTETSGTTQAEVDSE